jgi:hypothetical protein
MPNQSLKVSPARNAPAAVAKQKKAENLLDHFLKYIKPKYLNGQNSIGRAQSGNGFMTAKNASLNIPALFGHAYDPAQRIRPGDPATQLRDMTKRIGMVERIHNTYVPGRGVKLAD